MSFAARALSLAAAAALSMGLLLLPAMRGREITAAGHAWLAPLLMVVCALFVHGIGWRAARPWGRALLSPWLLWPLAIALACIWWRRS